MFELDGARTVVTGGAGFLGSPLCDALLASGATVICVDNLSTGSERNIAHLTDHDRFEFRRQDVTTYIDIDGEVDAVLHLASPASPIDYLELPIQTLEVGALGTHNTLGLAKDKDARLLLASTSEVDGDPQVHPQPESYWGNVNPIGPRGVYDEAKRFAEAMAFAYHRTDEVGPVNLGRPDELTITALAESVMTAVGNHPGVTSVPRPIDDPQVRCPDITLARRVLEWSVVTGLDEGLARTVAWYRAS